MKCYVVDGKGIANIALADRPLPKIVNENDVHIKVHACSLNYRDLMIAKGQYALGTYPPTIPLSDMAGLVIEVGSKVTKFRPGDRVLNAPFRHWPGGRLQKAWASSFIGGNGVDGVLAEQIVYPEDALVKVPLYLDMAEASTFTIAGLTAWAAVVTHGKTRPGEWVLLQGTGGVSIFAAQLARILGAKTIMTTSSPEKAKFVKSHFGIDETVNYRDADWYKQVKEITNGDGVDVVIDVTGGETLTNSLKICNFGARVAVIGVLGGHETVLPIRDLLKHQIAIRGIFMESAEELNALIQAAEAQNLKPQIDKVFSFEEVKEAYRHLEAQKHIGKVVIHL